MSSEDETTADRQVTAGDATGHATRPRRSGVGMDSVLRHLREHLSDQERDRRPRDDDHGGGQAQA